MTQTVRGETLEIRPGRMIDVAVQPGTDPAAPTLFFAHGGGGNKDQWREQWQAFAAQGYRLVAWDMLGHGRSEKPRQPSAYAWAELVADYLEVFRRYRGQRNVLVAHSLGTGLSLSALLRLEAEGAEVDAALLLGSQLHRPQAGGLFALPAWVLEILRPALAKGFRSRAWHPSADVALINYEEGLTRTNPLYVFKALAGQAEWPEADALAKLTLPIYILAGDSDGLTPAVGGEALYRHLPNARFTVLEECGHQLMLEKPLAVNAALAALLERTEKREAPVVVWLASLAV